MNEYRKQKSINELNFEYSIKFMRLNSIKEISKCTRKFGWRFADNGTI